MRDLLFVLSIICGAASVLYSVLIDGSDETHDDTNSRHTERNLPDWVPEAENKPADEKNMLGYTNAGSCLAMLCSAVLYLYGDGYKRLEENGMRHYSVYAPHRLPLEHRITALIMTFVCISCFLTFRGLFQENGKSQNVVSKALSVLSVGLLLAAYIPEIA